MLHMPTVFSVDSADPDRFDQSNGDTWRGRRALPDCSDAPVLRGFIPLGEFIRKFDRPVNAEHAAGYLERLSVEHVATGRSSRAHLAVKCPAPSSKKSGDSVRRPRRRSKGGTKAVRAPALILPTIP